VWWHGPWPLEPRITVVPGEIVRAWSYDTDWLYGEKVVRVGGADGKLEPLKPRQRGWFPDHCVRDDDDDVTVAEGGEPDSAFGCTGAAEPPENIEKSKKSKSKKNK
jgi:hypothetical protein